MQPVLYPVPLLMITLTLLIRAELLKKQTQIYIFKPLSTLLVISTALLSMWTPDYNLTYTIGITAGLLLSFGGDLSLMFQQKRKAFMLGLVLFLLAHVVYTVIFSIFGVFTVWDSLTAALLLGAGVGFYRLMRMNLGTMRIPVIAYIVIISLMVNRAASASLSPDFSQAQALLVLFGALLFYVSDVILAANKFWKHWKYNRISLVFYYSGQLLIALSAGYFG